MANFSYNRVFAFKHSYDALAWLRGHGRFTTKGGEPMNITNRGLRDMQRILVTLWRLAQKENDTWRRGGQTVRVREGEVRKPYAVIIDALSQLFPDDYSKRKLEYRIEQMVRAGLIQKYREAKPGYGEDPATERLVRFLRYGVGTSRDYWKVIRVVPLQLLDFIKSLCTSAKQSLCTAILENEGIPIHSWYWIDLRELWARHRERNLEPCT